MNRGPVAGLPTARKDTLWERAGYELEPGDRVPFVLSFDLAPEEP